MGLLLTDGRALRISLFCFVIVFGWCGVGFIESHKDRSVLKACGRGGGGGAGRPAPRTGRDGATVMWASVAPVKTAFVGYL
jgi:hypothetical protein